MKWLTLNNGRPFLFLQEAGLPSGAQVASIIIAIIEREFGGICEQNLDGLDWFDSTWRIEGNQVTVTSDTWLGLGLFTHKPDGDALLRRIAARIEASVASNGFE